MHVILSLCVLLHSPLYHHCHCCCNQSTVIDCCSCCVIISSYASTCTPHKPKQTSFFMSYNRGLPSRWCSVNCVFFSLVLIASCHLCRKRGLKLITAFHFSPCMDWQSSSFSPGQWARFKSIHGPSKDWAVRWDFWNNSRSKDLWYPFGNHFPLLLYMEYILTSIYGRCTVHNLDILFGCCCFVFCFCFCFLLLFFKLLG